MTMHKRLAVSAAAALLATTAANAQMFGDDYGTDLGYDQFEAGFGETGYYDAWDTDDDAGLTEGEFGSGIYADWDTDNDLQITEEEWQVGTERWYGADYEGNFTEWDADESGFIDQEEFGGGWDSTYYSEWDTDEDSVLNEEEFGTGLYNTADLDQDQVITVQEEGWFEGWFDGDDVEAEIEEVGDVL